MKQLVTSVFLGLLCSIVFAQPIWENPNIFQINQSLPHAPVIPYESVMDAIKNDRSKCRFYQSLNGKWKFNWVSKVSQAPVDFYKTDYNIDEWNDITVPSNWQMEGYGHPIFRNVTLEFPGDPPNVPDYYNPVGSYKHVFQIDKTWKDRRIFLHFEGVKSAFYVWINGQEVGYNQGSMEPAEFDITEFVKLGDNQIAVQVLRYSDGTYLENQDMWRLAGIYRNVYLFAAPEVHMRDYYVYTDFDKKYEDANLHVEVDISNDSRLTSRGYSIQVDVQNNSGKSVLDNPLTEKITVLPSENAKIRFTQKIIQPLQWSAEKPNLYTLTLELLNEDNEVIEAYAPKIGFRETEVIDGAVYVNGKRIKFNGVNSHVHHPETGKVMDEETIRRDFELMKQFNINLVRTSHYPPNVEYLDLANEYGIYVVDETNDECHGNIYLSKDTAWKEMFLDRVRKMVYRDRNHPCIVFWSAGNEAGSGDNIKALIEEGRHIDPSRPAWMYGGNTFHIPFEDIIGPRYWIPFELKKLAEQDAADVVRPSFMDEYLAATGNSMGGLDEYWELIHQYPRLTGGAIWDWVSPGITHPLRILPDRSPNNNNGAIMGRAKQVDGKFGKALKLSGHDEWVEFYRDPSLDITGNELTMDIWVNPDEFIHTNYFLSKGDHQYGLLQKNKDSLEFYIYSDQRVTAVAPVPENWLGNWHHLAGIFDGKTVMLYVNGQLAATNEHQGYIKSSPFPLTMGRSSEKHDCEHPGMLSNAALDHGRVFDRVVAIEQLQTMSPEASTEIAALFIDFENITEKEDFFMTGLEGRTYGLVWPNRAVQPELWQVKKSAQPLKIKALNIEQGSFSVTNRYHFTNLSELEASWNVKQEDNIIKEGTLSLNIAPDSSDIVYIPLNGITMDENEDYWLTISVKIPEDQMWAAAGHEVAWEQFKLKSKKPAEKASRETNGTIRLSENETIVTVTGTNFRYTFDKSQGKWTELQKSGNKLIKNGPMFNVWRAPLANDIDQWNSWNFPGRATTPGLGRSLDNHWRTMGIDDLNYKIEQIDIIQADENLLKMNVIETAYTSTNTGGFRNYYSYIIHSDGRIDVSIKSNAQGDMPQWLPRIGLQWQLPEQYEEIKWYGRGPYENYPDRKTGAKMGVYISTVKEEYVPYLIPQDHGNKTDVYWVEFTNSKGNGLRIESHKAFNFSAHPYSTEQLERAMYPFQLKNEEVIYLNTDPEVTGVGDTSKSTLLKYRVMPGTYSFAFTLVPM